MASSKTHLAYSIPPSPLSRSVIDTATHRGNSECIVERLRANRVPHVYRLYEGEGHGFRKAETLVEYYQTVERFLREQVIYNVSKGAL